MKNIWKWLMIAMMAMVMIGCPQENKSDDDDDEGGEGGAVASYKPLNGVFSISGTFSKISTGWGGSEERPTFSVVFLDDTVEAAVKDGTITDLNTLPAGMSVFQLQGFGNGAFKTAESGDFKVYGVDTGDDYAGFAVTVDADNSTFTLYVDGSKLQRTQLKGIGQEFGASGRILTNSDPVDLSNVVPYAVALINDAEAENYIGGMWSAQMHKLSATEDAYPSNPKSFPNVKPATIDMINMIRGQLIEALWDGVALTNGAYEVDLTEAAEDTKIRFKFTVDGYGWDFQVGGIPKTNDITDGSDTDTLIVLGEKTELISKEELEKDPQNCNITLPKGKTYSIKFELDEEDTPYVTVSEKD